MIKASVEENSFKTKKFLNHLLQEMMDLWPLHPKQIIEIKMSEEAPYFPAIAYYSDSYPDGKYITDELSGEGDMLGSTLLAISDYTQKEFAWMCAPLVQSTHHFNPLVIGMPFVIIDPDKIRKKAEENGVTIKSLETTENDKANSKSKDDKFTLFLEQDGDLWRKPREVYCYHMVKDKGRYKLLHFLAENKGYQQTAAIQRALERKSRKSLRSELGKINTKIQGALKIKNHEIIEGMPVTGYRINPKLNINIVLH